MLSLINHPCVIALHEEKDYKKIGLITIWLNYNYFHIIYSYFKEYALEAEGKKSA